MNYIGYHINNIEGLRTELSEMYCDVIHYLFDDNIFIDKVSKAKKYIVNILSRQVHSTKPFNAPISGRNY